MVLLRGAVLSPMAGVTDVAFRALAKRYGAALTYTEFVSSAAIVRGNTASLRLLETDPSEKPVAVQLFGSSVAEVVAAAKVVEHKFDVIDINCGCPAWKVVRGGAGAALLSDPGKIAALVEKLVKAVAVPVTVKIRAGIKEVNAVEVAKAIEHAGGGAVAVHGRTQKQRYTGVADWEVIRQVKEAVDIPVIGNGDVTSPELYKQRVEESGVDAVMIARGAMGNPAIFGQIKQYMEAGSYDAVDKRKLFAEYVELAEQYHIPLSQVRNHAMQFTKGMVGGASLRRELTKAVTIEKISEMV